VKARTQWGVTQWRKMSQISARVETVALNCVIARVAVPQNFFCRLLSRARTHKTKTDRAALGMTSRFSQVINRPQPVSSTLSANCQSGARIRERRLRYFLALLLQRSVLASVGDVGRLPDIGVQFALQGKFVSDLGLPVFDGLLSDGLANQSGKMTCLRERR
jgi:hypothetical protein